MFLKRAILGVSIYMLLTAAQCTTQQALDNTKLTCMIESNAHTVYVGFIAPSRPPKNVAFEAKLYGIVDTLCKNGGTIDQIDAAIAQAQSARAK